MSNKWGVKPEQVGFLEELEKIIGKSIECREEIKFNIFGVKIDEDNITLLYMLLLNPVSSINQENIYTDESINLKLSKNLRKLL